MRWRIVKGRITETYPTTYTSQVVICSLAQLANLWQMVDLIPGRRTLAIRRFKGTGTDDIYNKRDTNKARKLLHPDLWDRARRILNHLDTPNCIDQLKEVHSFHLEELKRDLKGWWSARVNGQYRVLFKYDKENDAAYDVHIFDYH